LPFQVRSKERFDTIQPNTDPTRLYGDRFLCELWKQARGMSIAIVFHENKQTEQDYIIKKFQKDGFLITKSSISRMILICTSDDLLEKEAERINLLIHNKHNVLQTFLTENRSQFLLNKAQREIFKPSEKNLLLLSLLEQVK
jgi:hypothetical protein